MHTRSDDDIVGDVLKGDAQAFGLIVRRYEKPIFNLMLRATGSMDGAADLCQEAFLKAFDRVQTYRPGKSFYAWLYALALNTVRDEIRHRNTAAGKAEQKTDHAADFETMRFDNQDPERLSETIGLYQALAAIPLEYREALLLHYREGLVSREIAQMIGTSVSGAKMRIKRGLEMLRQRLKDKNHAIPKR